MANETTIPRLGSILRDLIKAGGYRAHLVDIGLDKDLDDLALDTPGRQGAIAELLEKLVNACSLVLAKDVGSDWEQTFRSAWYHSLTAVQYLTQHVDSSPLDPTTGRALFSRHFAIPMFAGLLGYCSAKRPAPNLDLWWESPFKAWVVFAASKAQIPEQALLENLANGINVDQRSIERWLAGEPIGKLACPYAPRVKEALGQQALKQLKSTDIELLTGWLLLATAYQSLPPSDRDAAKRDFAVRKQHPWSPETAAAALNHHAERSRPRSTAAPLLQYIEGLSTVRPLNEVEIQARLNSLQRLIDDGESPIRNAYQYRHDWLSAHLFAHQGKQEEALSLYSRAVAGAWWKAGQKQHPLLNEALLFAVGVGDKWAAANLWDKTFLLGLNKGPKRDLDEQEMRRISFGFEKKFHPQKAKERIPPPREVILRDGDFAVERKHLTNPNQKIKHAEGRTRRTPLMDAICEGTLADVQSLINAGGDPNDFIKESGEGPLTYAMRRACDRKDTLIMDFLLQQDLLPETINRPASTKRETPLKIAIEMANAQAVTRLIELGADVEQPCDYLQSALCYAMSLFKMSLHKNDPTQENAFFTGEARGDVYDAKDGAVLDVDLAARRQRLRTRTMSSERYRQILEEVKDYFIHPADDYREVIRALMLGGANPNRRYRVEPLHLDEWTPTLFAAEVGDLDVFKMLVESPGENRGDPSLTLQPPSDLERFDALWVAIAYGRHAIVSYLNERGR